MTIITYYIIGAILSIPWNTGIAFSYFQHFSPRYAKELIKEDLGSAIFIALIGCLIWPAATILLFCLSGFYQHGWFKRG